MDYPMIKALHKVQIKILYVFFCIVLFIAFADSWALDFSLDFVELQVRRNRFLGKNKYFI
jgi:hypothetical protein